MAENEQLSSLRQALRQKLAELDRILRPAFERGGVFPGYFQVFSRLCGKSGCRCRQGQPHAGARVLVALREGQRVLSLKPEEIETWKSRTAAYKRIRSARRAFRKWQAEVVALVDEIERARRSLEGLSVEERDLEFR